MDKPMLWKLIIVAVLIAAYVVIAALDLHREITAPIIVIIIAVVLFLPIGRKKRERR